MDYFTLQHRQLFVFISCELNPWWWLPLPIRITFQGEIAHDITRYSFPVCAVHHCVAACLTTFLKSVTSATLCLAAFTVLPTARSYTGFLPGGQHHMAKTYGKASSAALKERQANDDPLKWRKFVSYAEFTPPHTPAEGHHVPGYSGHVPGVYAENLYAKTYGKTTFQAVSGKFPKGCEQTADERVRSYLSERAVCSHVHTRTQRPSQSF